MMTLALTRRFWLVGSSVGMTLLSLLAISRVTGVRWQSEPVKLLNGGLAPAFSLIDQQGRPFTSASLQGKVWVADFIFTACPGQCLLMTDQLAGLQRMFPMDSRVQFVSFSVDAAHDSPDVLTAYAVRYGADLRWHLLTGDGAAIERLSREGFRLAAAGDGKDPIVHSTRLVLVDAQGRLRGYYDAASALEMVRLRRAMRQLLDTST